MLTLRMVLMFSCVVARLLDLRRRLTAVLDVLDGIQRVGVSLSSSSELTVQWC